MFIANKRPKNFNKITKKNHGLNFIHSSSSNGIASFILKYKTTFRQSLDSKM